MSDNQGLVDFAIKLVSSALTNEILGAIQITEELLSILLIKTFFRQAKFKMTLRLVHAIYSLPKWKALKPTSFCTLCMYRLAK